jgi:hypothetical protein
MGCDPGTQNFAWCIDGPDGLEDHDVEEGIRKDVTALGVFAERTWRVLRRFQPDAVVIERYHPRAKGAPGGSFVPHTEKVNLMIGVVWTQCMMLQIPCHLTTASVHKVWAARNMGATKKGGKLSMGTVAEYGDYLPTEHECDAANLARYGRMKAYAGKELKCQGTNTSRLETTPAKS